MSDSEFSGSPSRLNTAKSLDHFIANKDRKTLALNGKWGCGKTFFWERYLSEWPNNAPQRRSYVSLFDVSSLKELKSKIIVESTAEYDEEWAEGLEKAVKGLKTIVEAIPFVEKFVKSDSVFSAIEEKILNGFLICLDDIERRSKNLDMGQLLGFVSVLREHHDCRVVLILNEDQLDEDDQKVLNKYRDKIIDMELQFRPSVRENAEIVLEEHEFKEMLVEVYELSGTNNIRVMQKTLWRVERLLEILPDELSHAREDMTKQLAILCCLHYAEDDRVDVNKIRGLQSWHSMLSDKDPQDESALLAERLGTLGWEYPTHEGTLIDIVLHEVFDEEAILKAADKIQATYKDMALREEIERPFERFRANFQGDLEEIRQELQALLDNRVQDTDWSQLRQVLSLLQDLGIEQDVAKYQSQWIDAHPEVFSNEETVEEFLYAIDDPEVKRKVEAVAEEKNERLDLMDCMVQVAYRKSWGGHEDRALKSATKDDFVELMTTRQDSGLLNLLREFLSLAPMMGKEDGSGLKMAERIKAALAEVAGTSDLNRIRIEKFFGSQLVIPLTRYSAAEDQDAEA